LSNENNLEAFIARELKIISGARVTIFNEYSHSNRTIAVRHIEMEPQLLKKVVSLLSKRVNGIVSKVSKEDYQVMVSEIIGVRNTLYEASFGSIPKTVAAAIQRLINVDRFIGIAYIVDGKIYGTSLLAMDKDRPDPPKEILENFAFLTAMSLRRKQAEEALEEREAEYRSLFENSIMGISQSYPDGGFKRINKAYAEMYGYPDTSTMMKEVSSNVEMLYFHSEDREKVLEILDKTGHMPPTEFELNRRNGEKFWALVSARKVKDNAGKLLYLQAEHRDITSRKKLEKDMYSASLYARSLIEASLDPLITINAEGKITDVNLSTEKITGITRKKLIGSDFADYFENPDKARTGYKTVFSEGMVKDYPLTILHKSRRKIDVLYNATLFKNEKGEIQGIFAARDITDLKKMEEELLKSHELLEKLNQHLINAIEEERNQIALNLHDDLGQKLTAINLDIAWLKGRVGVQSKTVLEKFEEMSTMIKETIESIKETSSFLRPAILFDLGLVPAIKSQLDKFEKQTGIKCHFYFRPQDFLLEDRLALILYRILQESLTNIARHSGASKAYVNLYVLKNKIEMIIKDDGTGIEKNKVNSFKSLGIAGIKERVKSVDGRITITGVHGSGTLIRVAIPLLKMKTND
jgi:PAS domain S-box-containing protein